MLRRLSLGGTLVLAVAACGGSATSVDVRFDAEPGAAARATKLRVVVRDDAGATVLDSTRPIGDGGGAVRFPTGVRLAPRGGDASRGFAVEGTLLDASDAVFARVAARGSYVAGERREIRLLFEDACTDRLCPESETCRAGACGDACVVPARPGDDALPCGMDAGMPVDATTDAPGPDGGDAGDDAGIDAGDPGTPTFLFREVPQFTHDGTSSVEPPRVVTTLDLPAGPDRLVLVSGVLSSESTLPSASIARLLIDTDVRGTGSSHNFTANAGGPFLHFAVARGDAARRVTVDLQNLAAGLAGNPDAVLRDLRIVAFPVPAGGDLALVENDLGGSVLASSGWAPMAELVVRPASAGRTLVLAAASVREGPGTGGAEVRLVDATGADWPVAGAIGPLAVTSDERQTFFLARAVDLSPGDRRFSLQIRAASPSSLWAHARIAALRTDALRAFHTTEALTEQSSSSATPAVVASVDVPAGVYEDRIAILSVVLRAAGRRGAELTAPGSTVRFEHENDEPEAVLSYGAVHAARAAEAGRYEVRFFAAGTEVDAKEAVLHVLVL